MSDTPFFCKIGTTDISPYVRSSTKIGGSAKYSSASIPGAKRYSMHHEGIDPRGWTLELWAVHDTEEGSLDTVMALFDNAQEDTRFYPFSSSKFARILKSDVAEAADNIHKISSIWKAAANVYATVADLFDDSEDTWYPQ